MPNDIPSDSYSVTLTDQSVEKSSTQFACQAFATNATYAAARNAFESALATATLGTVVSRTEALVTRLAAGTTGSGQRELKWLVRLIDDSTFKPYSFTLPTADTTAYTFQSNSDLIDLSAAPAPALVTAIEDFYMTPDGNTATVSSIQLVGRNI